MTVMHIDFRIPIVPNGSCYGSDFEVFEIFFKSIARVHHYIGYYLLNATHTHSTSSQRNLCRFFLLSTMQKGLQMKSLKHTSTKKKKPNKHLQCTCIRACHGKSYKKSYCIPSDNKLA